LDCITPIRFSVGDADKGATKCGESMSDQLTVFSSGAFVMVYKGWHLREAMRWQSKRSYSHFTNQLILFYLKLHIIPDFFFYSKPSFQLSPLNVKTLDLTVEYVFQLEAYVNTWYLYAPLQRVQSRFLVKLYQKWEYRDF